MWSMYRQMLQDVGISTEDLPTDPDTDKPVDLTRYPQCKRCQTEPLSLWSNGFLTCHECGLVNTEEQQWDHTDVPGYYKIHSTKALNGTTFERRRSYKPITHFKEHLRRYMGARFTEIPDQLLDKLKYIDVKDPYSFNNVKKALKKHGFRKYYKEVFLIIYKLGGTPPNITDQVFHQCVTAYNALMIAFERKKAEWKRHSMPSNYVMLDVLLRHFGHEPYYVIPNLKDADLQDKVEWMISELDQYWKFQSNKT